MEFFDDWIEHRQGLRLISHHFLQLYHLELGYSTSIFHQNRGLPGLSFYLFQPLGEKGRRARRGTLKARIGSFFLKQFKIIYSYTKTQDILFARKKFKMKIIP